MRTVLLILAFIVLAQAKPQSKGPTYTYLQSIRQNICAYASNNHSPKPTKIPPPDLTLNLTSLLDGNSPLISLNASTWFIPKILFYLMAFVVLWFTLKEIKIRMLQKRHQQTDCEPFIKNVNTHRIICCVTMIMVFLAIGFSTTGINIAKDIHSASTSFICKFLHFPDNFSKSPQKTAPFNDYQHEAMNLRQLFREARMNASELDVFMKDKQFVKNSKNLLSEKDVLDSIEKIGNMAIELRNGSKFMASSLSYEREILLQLRGYLFFIPSFINSYVRIDKVAPIIQSSLIQFYAVVGITSLVTLGILVSIMIGRHLKGTYLLRLPPFLLGFIFFTCLVFCLCGNIVLLAGGNACHILAQYPKMSELFELATQKVHFYQKIMKITLLEIIKKTENNSDGNFATFNSQIYEKYEKAKKHIQTISDYEVRTVLQANSSPKMIQYYQQQMPQFKSRLTHFKIAMQTVEQAVSPQGSFGELTLRPYGEYIESLTSSICQQNHILWVLNHDNCIYCMLSILGALACYYFLLKFSEESYRSLAADDEVIELKKSQKGIYI